jgi:uncharacterized membrane protein (DUF373 family)
MMIYIHKNYIYIYMYICKNMIFFILSFGLFITGYRLFHRSFLIECDFNHICKGVIVPLALYRNLFDN